MDVLAEKPTRVGGLPGSFSSLGKIRRRTITNLCNWPTGIEGTAFMEAEEARSAGCRRAPTRGTDRKGHDAIHLVAALATIGNDAALPVQRMRDNCIEIGIAWFRPESSFDTVDVRNKCNRIAGSARAGMHCKIMAGCPLN